jgi:hypothetical protein
MELARRCTDATAAPAQEETELTFNYGVKMGLECKCDKHLREAKGKRARYEEPATRKQTRTRQPAYKPDYVYGDPD